jgi:uncharacterized protein (DUF849 family)
VPLSPREIASDALACLAAGASIIHSHIEAFALTGTRAAERYLEGWRPILSERPDAILYGTGASAETIEERCSHTEALGLSGVMRMGFIDPGSVNFGTFDDRGMPGEMQSIYSNPFAEIEYSFSLLERTKLGPSIAVYEPGFHRASMMYWRVGRMPRGAQVKFYFSGDHNFIDGRKGQQFWGLPPTRKALDVYLEMMEGTGLPWAVSVMGGDVTATGLAQLALERGGHIRLGLEDFAGSRTPTNAELVAEVVAMAHKVGRDVAASAAAAALLDLPRR